MKKLTQALISAILMGCTLSCVYDKEPEGPSRQVGESLPDFSVVMNDGTVVSTASLKGSVPVIVFFNTACPDCQQELPVIQKLWENYIDIPQVRIVPIAREESEAEILQYWKAHNLTMPFSPQETRDVYSLFAPSIIPRIYIADPSGKIIASYGDQDMPSLQALESVIEKILATYNQKRS